MTVLFSSSHNPVCLTPTKTSRKSQLSAASGALSVAYRKLFTSLAYLTSLSTWWEITKRLVSEVGNRKSYQRRYQTEGISQTRIHCVLNVIFIIGFRYRLHNAFPTIPLLYPWRQQYRSGVFKTCIVSSTFYQFQGRQLWIVMLLINHLDIHLFSN